MEPSVLERLEGVLGSVEKGQKHITDALATVTDNSTKVTAVIGTAKNNTDAIAAAKQQIDGLAAKLGDAEIASKSDVEKMQAEVVRISEVIKSIQLGGMPGTAGQPSVIKSVAKQVIDSENYGQWKEYHKTRDAGMMVERKHLFATQKAEGDHLTGDGTNVGDLVTPEYTDVVIEDPKNQPLIRALMRVVPTDSNQVFFDREQAEYALVTEATQAEAAGSLTMTVKNAVGLSDAAPFRAVRIRHAATPNAPQDLTIASISGNVVTFTAAVTAAIVEGDRLEADNYIATPQAAYAPLSEDVWEDVNHKIVNLVTLARVSLQSLADPNRAETLFDRRLLNRAARTADKNYLYGAGGNDQMTGIFADADIDEVLWSASGTGTTKLEFVIKVIYMLYKRNHMPTAVVLHPDDHQDISLAKGTDGHYIFMQVQTAGAPTQIFAIPVLWSNQLEPGDGIVADWNSLGVIRDREQAQITIGTTGNDFAEGMRTIRAQERTVLAIEQPKAALKVKFDSAP